MIPVRKFAKQLARERFIDAADQDVGLAQRGKHGAIQYDKHMKAGKPFPVAIVIGCDPLGYLISGIEVPFGMCEYNYIGAILKQPVSVVKGQLTELPFPAASEIVIEGYAHPGDVKIEGAWIRMGLITPKILRVTKISPTEGRVETNYGTRVKPANPIRRL